MKRLILCVVIYLIAVLSQSHVKAENAVVTDHSEYIKNIYERIDFCNVSKPDFEVFEKACKGYINLKYDGKLNDKEILTICDLSKSSNEYRMWVIDLRNKKVLFNDYVAHGQGSGEEYATSFSNRPNSHQSSIGFYVTDSTYIGDHGLSLKLHGMDKGFNSAAYKRAIVLHGASYVCDKFIAKEGRLGRSWGCPAVSETISDDVIDAIKDGTCMFIYYPSKKYATESYWLNKKPGYIMFAANVKRDTVIIYDTLSQTSLASTIN